MNYVSQKIGRSSMRVSSNDSNSAVSKQNNKTGRASVDASPFGFSLPTNQ